MGATSSVALTSEMAEKLSEQSVRTFKRFEEELCLRNVSPEEAQELMLAKYNELKSIDKLRSNVDSDVLCRSSMLSPSQRLPSLQCASQKSHRREGSTRPIRSASFLKITAASAQKMVVLPDIKNANKANNAHRKGWGRDPQAKLRREERAKLFDAFSSLNKRPSSSPKRPGTSGSRPRTAEEDGLVSHPLAFSESLPELSLSTPSTDLPPTHREAFLPNDWALPSTLGERSPNVQSKDLATDSVDTVDLHDSCTDDESVCSTLTEISLSTEPPHDDPPLSHRPHVLPPPLKKTLSMIPESFDCKLCKKRFPTKALLHTHLSYSQLHRQHLLDLRRKYTCAYEEVDRIDQVLKKAVEQFYSLLTCQRLRKQAMRVHRREEIRLRWKQAVQKVVFQCQAKKVARLLEEMQEQAQLAAERERSTFQSPPFLFYEDSKFFWRSQTRFALQYFVHEHLQCIEVVPQLLPLAPREDMPGDPTGPIAGRFGKRVYLDSSVVLQSAREMAEREGSPLGLYGLFPRSESREGLWDEASAPSFTGGLGDPEPPSPQGSGRPRGEGRLPSSVSHALRDRSTARLVAAYIHSKLRLDDSAVAAGRKCPEQALFFDDRGPPQSTEGSPLLSSAPPSVAPVSLAPARWYSAADMAAKLDELRALQHELQVAVCRAETLARRLEERDGDGEGDKERDREREGQGRGRPAAGRKAAGAAVLPPLDPRGGVRPKHGARLAGVAL